MQWLLLLRSQAPGARASVIMAYRSQLRQGSWDPSGPGTEQVSPALADGFSTTGPLGSLPLWF